MPDLEEEAHQLLTEISNFQNAKVSTVSPTRCEVQTTAPPYATLFGNGFVVDMEQGL